jgi:hypothetical protein
MQSVTETLKAEGYKIKYVWCTKVPGGEGTFCDTVITWK